MFFFFGGIAGNRTNTFNFSTGKKIQEGITLFSKLPCRIAQKYLQISIVKITKMKMLTLQLFKAQLASPLAPLPHPIVQFRGVFQSACPLWHLDDKS